MKISELSKLIDINQLILIRAKQSLAQTKITN